MVYEKASTVCDHMDDLVISLTKLHQDSAKWKSKFISMKKSHFSKFLATGDQARSQQSFREWRNWWHEAKCGREFQALSLEQERLEGEWDEKMSLQELEHSRQCAALDASHNMAIAELNTQIKQRNEQIAYLTLERDTAIQSAERKARGLRMLRMQVENAAREELMDDTQYKPEPTNSFELMVARVHKLLEEVDTRYMGPLSFAGEPISPDLFM